MRQFHSYGPVDCEEHFCIDRKELIAQCVKQLIGKPGKGGHYFTIWAPRQTGKTWLMQQATKKIRADYGEKYLIGELSMQGLVMEENDPDDVFFRHNPILFRDGFGIRDVPLPRSWDEWAGFFSADKGLFDRPVILFIDEFDSLIPSLTDRLVGLFRNIYLKREGYIIHGLALIGVRAALGVESDRGSPFNIQRSLHISNLTADEVRELFRQYQEESGQKIDPAVVEKVYHTTNGQPGLVSWFGELMTEKYNPDPEQVIDENAWKIVYECACHSEFNNTVLNIIAKARKDYRPYVTELFSHSDISFSLDADWCNYMYLHGIIDREMVTSDRGEIRTICRFSSPFIQHRIYNALTYHFFGNRTPILALDPLDDLSDVFEGNTLDVPALLQRYKDYLMRLKAGGINPWQDQPRRKTDFHFTEASGHFNLYSWLRTALGSRCVVSPEFPTGNGKVDLHLRCWNKHGIIEVKSFVNAHETKEAIAKAGKYAKQMNLDCVTVALFIPVEDEAVLKALSSVQVIGGVQVTVVAIGQV